jgi:hypothetical protein
MRTPIASKSMDAIISIFDCGKVIIRLPRDATSWCPDNFNPKFFKSIEGNQFIFEAPNRILIEEEWKYLQSSHKQEVQQVSSQLQ